MLRRFKYFSIFLVMTLILVFVGCGVPKDQYNELQTKLDSLQKSYDTATAQLNTIRTELDSAQKQLASTESELDSAQDEIAQLQNSLDDRSASLTEAQSQVLQLQNQLNTILDTKITQFYQFAFQSITYQWQLPVDLRNYFNYKGKSRPTDLSKLGTMVTDADANTIISVLVNKVKDATTTYDLRKSDQVNLVAKFVQTLPGTNKNVLTPYDAYPRYPLETLFEQGGDSQDTAILAAALLSRLDFDVVLFSYDSSKHMAVGVNMPGSLGYGWEFQAKYYYYLETTGGTLTLGECPPEYRQPAPTIYPIS